MLTTAYTRGRPRTKVVAELQRWPSQTLRNSLTSALFTIIQFPLAKSSDTVLIEIHTSSLTLLAMPKGKPDGEVQHVERAKREIVLDDVYGIEDVTICHIADLSNAYYAPARMLLR
jgi:hypothetical protein